MRKLLSIFALTIYAVCLSAQTVGVDDAKSRAVAFLQKPQKSSAKRVKQSISNLSLAYTAEISQKPTLYAFNIDNGNGFIVMSADESTEQVLGYSDSGEFNYSTMPANVKWWIDNLSQQVRYQSQLSESGVNKMAKTDSNETPYYADWQPISPLLTSAWGQAEPYNNMTPMVNTTNHAPTGCVATAMAQVMNANRYPEHGYGSHSYTMKSFMSGNDTTLTAIYSQHVYDWDHMDYDYSYNYHSDPAGVAQLMSDCGIATDMQYGFGGSGTYSETVAPALINYFGYDDHTVCLYRDYFDAEHWSKIIYNELQQGRPVYYSGVSVMGGHAFVCDGYDDDNYFHFDFGWDGEYNGFFRLSAIKANLSGFDAGYNHEHAIVLAYPNSPGDSYPYSILCDYFSVETGTYSRQSSFPMSFAVENAYDNIYSFTYGTMLINETNDTTYIWHGNAEIDGGMGIGYCIDVNKFPTSGRYRIMPAFKDDNETITTSSSENISSKVYYADCFEDSVNISLSMTNNLYSLEVQSIDIADVAFANGGSIIKALIKNTSNLDFYSNISFVFENKSDGNFVNTCVSDYFNIIAGDTQIVEEYINFAKGKYKLKYIVTNGYKFPVPEIEMEISDEIIPEYEQDGMKFIVHDNKNATLSALTRAFSSEDDIVIPDHLEIGNYIIPVTAIGNSTFYCMHAHTIDIPESVQEIGSSAFWQCYADFIVHWQEPIAIDDDIYYFDEYACHNYNVLNVPEGTAEKYKRAIGWRVFHKINENGQLVSRTFEVSANVPCGGGEVLIDGKTSSFTSNPYFYKCLGDSVKFEFIPHYTNSIINVHDSGRDYTPLQNDNSLDLKIEQERDLGLEVNFGEKVGNAYYMAISPTNAVVIYPDRTASLSNLYSKKKTEIYDKVDIGGKQYDVVNFADFTQIYSDTIKVNWTNPFELNESAFFEDTYKNSVLDVPVGTAELYAQTKGWKNFNTITERGAVKKSMVSLYFNSGLPPFLHLFINDNEVSSGGRSLVNRGGDAKITIRKDSNYSTYCIHDQGESWDGAMANGKFNYDFLRKDTLSFDDSKWTLDYLFVNGKDYSDQSTDGFTVTLHNVSQNLDIEPHAVYKENGINYCPQVTNRVYLTVYDENGKYERTDTIYGISYIPAIWGRYSGHVVIPDSINLGLNSMPVSVIGSNCFSPTWPSSYLYQDYDNHYTIPESVDIPASVSLIEETAIYLPNLNQLVVHWTTPLDISEEVFYLKNSVWDDNSIFKNCILIVPEGTTDAYRQHPVWGLFENIAEGTDWQNYTLSDIKLHAIKIKEPECALSIGETSQMDINYIPANANNKNVTWTSSNPTVANVDDNGLIKALSNGEAFVTVTSDADTSITSQTHVVVGETFCVSVNNIQGLNGFSHVIIDNNARDFTDYKVARGRDITVKFEPWQIYDIRKLEINEEDKTDEIGESNSYIIKNIQENIRIHPYFAYKYSKLWFEFGGWSGGSNGFKYCMGNAYPSPDKFYGNVVIPEYVDIPETELVLASACVVDNLGGPFLEQSDCKNLLSISLPKTIAWITANGLHNNDVPYLIVNWLEPLDVEPSVFYTIDGQPSSKMFRTCTLVVPNGTVDSYKSHAVWGKFYNIIDVDEYAAGISDIKLDDTSNTRVIKYVENGRIVIKQADKQYTISGQRIN